MHVCPSPCRFTAEGSKLGKGAMVLAVASCNTTVVDLEHVVDIDGERGDELLDLVRTALCTKNIIPVKLTFNTDGVRVFLRISPGEDNQLRLGNTRDSKFSQPFKVRVRGCVCARVINIHACITAGACADG